MDDLMNVSATGPRPPTPGHLPDCVTCGHRAWAHGSQSGSPGEGEPCYAAVDVRGKVECRCDGGYRSPVVGPEGFLGGHSELCYCSWVSARPQRPHLHRAQLDCPTVAQCPMAAVVGPSDRVLVALRYAQVGWERASGRPGAGARVSSLSVALVAESLLAQGVVFPSG